MVGWDFRYLHLFDQVVLHDNLEVRVTVVFVFLEPSPWACLL
jgi:hypothetical protein